MGILDNSEFASLSNELSRIAGRLSNAKTGKEFAEVEEMLVSFAQKAKAKPELWRQFDIKVKILAQKLTKKKTGKDLVID